MERAAGGMLVTGPVELVSLQQMHQYRGPQTDGMGAAYRGRDAVVQHTGGVEGQDELRSGRTYDDIACSVVGNLFGTKAENKWLDATVPIVTLLSSGLIWDEAPS